MRRIILHSFLVTLITLTSCDWVKDKTKKTINKSGEIAGKTATEFVGGVAEGIDKTLQCEIVLSSILQEKGMATGKFSIENDSVGGENNLLIVYVIFNKDFKKEVVVKAMDKNGLENGRSKVLIEGKAGEANYIDFRFDKRTNIESKSKLIFE